MPWSAPRWQPGQAQSSRSLSACQAQQIPLPKSCWRLQLQQPATPAGASPQVGCSSNTGLLFKLPPSTPEQVHGLIAALFEAAGRCAPALSSSRGDL